MAPSSYRPPLKADHEKKATYTQTAETALQNPDDAASVATVLGGKGNRVFSVGPSAKVTEALTLLKEHRIGAVVVIATEGDLVGILSERDIVRRLAEIGASVLELPVAEVMTHDPITCSPDETLLEMLHRMTEGRFRHLPVMEDGRLAGVITIGDVVKYRLQELEYERLRMRQMIVG